MFEKDAEEYLQSIEGDDCVIITDREERKQAYIAGAKELETENNKLLDVINNQDVKIADLEKENEYQKQARSIAENAVVDLCKENAEQKDLLTKAKEIIKNLLILKKDQHGNTDIEWRVEVTEQAEQFLQEIEK